MSKTHRAQVILGLTAFMLGALVYVLDRPGESFVLAGLSLSALTPNVFGALGYSLPTFAHVFAFCLLTAALLAGGKKTALAVCLGWFLVEAAFELGQHSALAPALPALIPSWFGDLPILNTTGSYFIYGTFDPLDMLALTLGVIAAYVVIQVTARWRISHE